MGISKEKVYSSDFLP